MQTCPICTKSVLKQKHWVRCPKEGKAVCMDHCYDGCKYHKQERCGYKWTAQLMDGHLENQLPC